MCQLKIKICLCNLSGSTFRESNLGGQKQGLAIHIFCKFPRSFLDVIRFRKDVSRLFLNKKQNLSFCPLTYLKSLCFESLNP